GAAEHLLELGEFRVGELGTTDQRCGKPVDGALVSISELGVFAGEDRIDRLLREARRQAFANMRLADVVGLPMLGDYQDADLDLALAERRALIEKGADLLHAARGGGAVDPDFVGPEDAAAAGGELLEYGGLLGRELFRRNLENAVHEEICPWTILISKASHHIGLRIARGERSKLASPYPKNWFLGRG